MLTAKHFLLHQNAGYLAALDKILTNCRSFFLNDPHRFCNSKQIFTFIVFFRIGLSDYFYPLRWLR